MKYLDYVKKLNTIYLLLKIALFPLKDDGITWDIDFIKNAEWMVQEMGKRGNLCSIKFFDTWARKKGKLAQTTKGVNKFLIVWKNEKDLEKESYIRNIISRFGAYYNVYWELGNEIISKHRNLWRS